MKKKAKAWQPVLQASPHFIDTHEFEKVLDDLAEVIYSYFCQQKSDPKNVAIESETLSETQKSFRKSGSK